MKLRAFVCGITLVLVSISTPTMADVLTFEQFSGPSFFSATAGPGTPQTLTIATSIGNVVISGGVILTNESNLPADTTSVYFTASPLPFGFGSTSQVITLTFSQNINNFFLNVYNGQTHDDSFTVADNAGHSSTVSIAPNTSSGMSLVSFPAAGSVVTITTSDTSWDFSIDNIGFNQPTPSTVPEPASVVLILTGLTGLVGRRRSGARPWRDVL